jgi:hypothetical protein
MPGIDEQKIGRYNKEEFLTANRNVIEIIGV